MSNRRRILWYSFLFVLAGGLLFWQWWSEPRYEGKRLATWIDRIGDADPTVRTQAAKGLGVLGLNSDPAWKELATLSLYDPDQAVRDQATASLTALCQTHSHTNEAKRLERKRGTLQSLIDGLKIGNVEVRRRVPAVIYEVAGLEYYDRALRRTADDKVDQEMRPTAVSALIAALKDPDGDVRDAAVGLLAHLDRIPTAAEPALLEQARSPDAVSRIGALLAMKKLEQKSPATADPDHSLGGH